MPVEIRELIIRAYVEADKKKEVKDNYDSSMGNESSSSSSEEIERLLEVINSKNER